MNHQDLLTQLDIPGWDHLGLYKVTNRDSSSRSTAQVLAAYHGSVTDRPSERPWRQVFGEVEPLTDPHGAAQRQGPR